jgi:hypothetical protein
MKGESQIESIEVALFYLLYCSRNHVYLTSHQHSVAIGSAHIRTIFDWGEIALCNSL